MYWSLPSSAQALVALRAVLCAQRVGIEAKGYRVLRSIIHRASLSADGRQTGDLHAAATRLNAAAQISCVAATFRSPLRPTSNAKVSSNTAPPGFRPLNIPDRERLGSTGGRGNRQQPAGRRTVAAAPAARPAAVHSRSSSRRWRRCSSSTNWSPPTTRSGAFFAFRCAGVALPLLAFFVLRQHWVEAWASPLTIAHRRLRVPVRRGGRPGQSDRRVRHHRDSVRRRGAADGGGACRGDWGRSARRWRSVPWRSPRRSCGRMVHSPR